MGALRQKCVKVNVHGATPFIPFQNVNLHGIGMVRRNAKGEFLKLSTGILPTTSLGNKLNALHHGLIRAFEDNYKYVILETDNLDAFKVIKDFPIDTPPDVAEAIQQIQIRLNDPRWFCAIVYVFPGHNKPAAYLTKLGGERCKQLYTLTRPVGALEELLSLDLGFGHVAPEFQVIEILPDEEDPVDFGPAHLTGEGIIHGGYAFKEDFFAMDDGINGPVVMPIHEAEMEDLIIGTGPVGQSI